MATINDWNKYLNVVHELALIEDTLIGYESQYGDDHSGNGWAACANTLRYEFFDL
jgi:hypothetical protein